MIRRPGSILAGSLLISGTAIGAGMLALPFATGVAGFWPALLVSFLSWLYMLFAGLLFLEVTLWSPNGANVLSMTKHFLGPAGWIVGGAAYIYLYYSLLVAYISGGVPIFSAVCEQTFGINMPEAWGFPIFTIIFGIIVYWGHTVAARINVILVAGMIISYFALLGLGAPEVKSELLQAHDWRLAWAAAPTLFSAYGYLNIIPSVSMYLRRDIHKLRWAVFIGTLIPFIVYTLWQWLMIGAIPQDTIIATMARGEAITRPLELLVATPWVSASVRYFALFALTTSVIGVGISMVDFLGDGTKIPRAGWGRALLVLCTFVPPLILAWAIPGLFFKALHYAGGFGEATLNGILPALMVWVGRWRLKLKPAFRLPLGRVSLSFVILIAMAIILGESLELAGLWR